MTEISTLWQAFGITGLVVALAVMLFRATWPFFRDTWFVRRLEAQEKQADAMRDIATLAGSMRQDVAEVKAGVQDTRLDMSKLFGHLEIEQPSRPRRPASTTPGASV